MRVADPARALVDEAVRRWNDDPRAALELLKRVLVEQPTSPYAAEAEVGVGDALVEDALVEDAHGAEAIPHHENVSSVSPVWRYPQHRLGWSYVSLGGPSKAITAFQHAADGTNVSAADAEIITASVAELRVLGAR